MAVTLNAGFLDGERGRLFCLSHDPAGDVPIRGHALILPPFAEEMNCARRFMKRLAVALADAGMAVRLVDPYGTGDSAGDFDAADWALWLSDGQTICRQLADAAAPLTVIGLRTGALLAAQLCAAGSPVARLGLIDPVVDGQKFLRQFLRLRIAANMRHGVRESTRDLLDRLTAGEAVDVAGYRLPPGLANPLGDLSLSTLPMPTAPVYWYALTPPGATDTPVYRPPAGWDAAHLHHRTIESPAFWQAAEPPHDCPAVAAAIRADLASPASAAAG